MKPFSNSSSPSSLSQQSHQPLSPEDATHLASILLFQLETQPPMLQPHAEDVLRVYSAALPAFGIAQADLAAAALCHAPLPQGFMRSYESALEKLMREEQQEPGSQKSKHAQGTSSMSTVGHFQGTLEVGSQGEIGKVVPQLVSMVLQPLLLLHQPVTSQLLLKAVVANWSASAASLRDGRSGQASTEQQHDYPGVLAAAAVILQTVSQGPSAPTGRLQDMLNAMATEALQLAVAETSHSHASVLVGPCVAESAALLNAVGTYSQRFKPATALLPSPPRRVGRLQPPPLQNSAATAAAGAATVDAASCGLHRDAWLRGMMTVLRVVGQGDCLPGQPWVGLSTADLISVSHTIAVELSGQQGQESVLAVFRDYLAGPVPAGIAAQGLETVGPAELVLLAKAWEEVDVVMTSKLGLAYRTRLYQLLPSLSPSQLVALLQCKTLISSDEPCHGQSDGADTKHGLIRAITEAILSSQIRRGAVPELGVLGEAAVALRMLGYTNDGMLNASFYYVAQRFLSQLSGTQLTQISMFVLETPDNAPSSSDLKRSIATTVLGHCVRAHASQEASHTSRPSPSTPQPPLAPSAAASVVLSQSDASSHTSFLLILVLSVTECHLPHATPPATLDAVAAAVQRCQSPSGPAVLKRYSTTELRFMADCLARHFGTTPDMAASDSPQQVGGACASLRMSGTRQR
ncbi:MAG: hypothetical protein WDW36_003082 [Sanguina aurantia]